MTRPKLLEEGFYCQNSFCPTRTTQYELQRMVRIKEIGHEYKFCSVDCKEGFKKYHAIIYDPKNK